MAPVNPNSNGTFDRRITTYGSVGTVDSYGRGVAAREVAPERGYIRTDPKAFGADGTKPALRYLYFLYNPATISTNYGMQWDAPTTALAVRTDSGQADPLTQLQQGLDFSLLFDRTYEVMDGDNEGAWRDVRAALAMTGIMNRVGEEAMYSSGSNFDTGPMLPIPMYFHFGNQRSGLTYYGYLTSLSIEYTHFSKDMVPIRVGMRMSANMLPSMKSSSLYQPPPVRTLDDYLGWDTGNGQGPGPWADGYQFPSDKATWDPADFDLGDIPNRWVPNGSPYPTVWR
ncbi:MULTISPECIES: CIS tube protein [Streptosporangium]|uniref:Contractile injection system tube protein N-terminal domain-containing protein n=1 Tax=Streptosporangium brasiliense TaxID=47480 RepID=A0ABT9RPV9_9ACTN|nr:hypothetical protein [Streptosporangium brasiliense]MDP9870320.1 hypothetical protein [Streptosporangium brasiliense]